MSNSNILWFIIAMAVPALLGFTLTSSALPPRFSWLRVALATGVGTGVCGFVYFLFRRPMFNVEIMLLLVAGWLLWHRRQAVFGELHFSIPSALLLAIVVCAATMVLQALLVQVLKMPHGNWDGWAIWNWEARLLYRGGSHWRDYLPLAFHGDYPLLVPSTTARFWRYIGTEIPEVGGWLGIVLMFSSMAVLGLTLAELRSAVLGTLMALTLAGTPNYLSYAASQYADIPVGFFFLACLALVALYFERHSEPHALRMLVLAGFLAGCAGWTKNEGVMFIIAVGIGLVSALVYDRSEGLRRLAAFAKGLAFPLFIIVFFKLTNKVQNYVVAYSPGKFEKIFDLDRHTFILRYGWKYILAFGVWVWSPYIPLAIFILLMGIHRPALASRGWLVLVVSIGVLVVGYYFVYLTTPLDLKYHIESSMDRLLLQLWPSILLIVGLMCKPSRINAAD